GDALEAPPGASGRRSSDFGGPKQAAAESPAADLVAYYGHAASDVYFQRAQKTLSGAKVDALVAMDFFASKAGVLCGVAEAVRLLSEILEGGCEAHGAAVG